MRKFMKKSMSWCLSGINNVKSTTRTINMSSVILWINLWLEEIPEQKDESPRSNSDKLILI
jgi:hypothetical protein